MSKQLAKQARCGKNGDVAHKSSIQENVSGALTRRHVPLWRRLLIGGNLRWTLFRLLILLIVVSVGKLHFFPDGKQRYKRILVDGKSMHPTYKNGRKLWMHTLEYANRIPQRGDVVVLGNEDESPLYIKRIIGLPGERIGIRHGQMTINGDLYEDYGHGRIEERLRPITLANGQFFVMGDNRPISSGGVVEVEKILGKIL